MEQETGKEYGTDNMGRGYPYLYTAPYAHPLWWTPGLYYGGAPGAVAACGSGMHGGCAAGTCGGSVAQGGCGGAAVSFLFRFLFFSLLVALLVIAVLVWFGLVWFGLVELVVSTTYLHGERLIGV